DGEPPRYGDVNAPDAHASDQQIADGEAEQHHEQERECETRDPAGRRAARQHDRADLVGDRPEGVTGADHRRKVRLAVDDSGRQLIHGHRFRSPSPQKKCTVGRPTCGGLINEAFSCHQAAWLRSLRRLDNLRYIARRLLIVSGRRSRHERLLRTSTAKKRRARRLFTIFLRALRFFVRFVSSWLIIILFWASPAAT